MQEKLFGKTLEELKDIAITWSFLPYTGKQLSEWIYKKRISGFEEMTNLSKKARALLRLPMNLEPRSPWMYRNPLMAQKNTFFQHSRGNSLKQHISLTENRNTVCVSSQVGCKMGCLFCMTGKQGFQGNLICGRDTEPVPESSRMG